MAKLADAADLKSAGPKRLWGFKSPSGHQPLPLRPHQLSHVVPVYKAVSPVDPVLSLALNSAREMIQ